MMTPSERAKDRAVKRTKGKHHLLDYKYNAKTNRATLMTKRRGRG